MLQFVSEAFQLRTRATHNAQCSSLGGPLHNHYATTYGIHQDSILNSSRYFHVTDGLVPDVMNNVLYALPAGATAIPAHTDTHVHVHIHVHMDAHIHVHVHTNIHVHVPAHMPIYVLSHMHMYTRTSIHTCIRTHIDVHIHMLVYVRVLVHVTVCMHVSQLL